MFYVPTIRQQFSTIPVGSLFFREETVGWMSLLRKTGPKAYCTLDNPDLHKYHQDTSVLIALRLSKEAIMGHPRSHSTAWLENGQQVWLMSDGELKSFTRGITVPFGKIAVGSLCFCMGRLNRRADHKTLESLLTGTQFRLVEQSLVQIAVEIPVKLPDSQFKNWANLYLGNFFAKVVNASADNIDREMEASFRRAEKHLGKQHLDFTKFLGIEEPTIDHAELEAFVDPVKAIFKAETAMPDDDIFAGPYDILDINPDPVAIESPFESPEFKKKVLNVLTYCLARGWKSVASFHLAKYFKVPQRDLEHWLDNNSEFVCKRGQTPGVFYYSMSKKEGVFPIGSDDFVQQLTQVLRDDNKPWKSPGFLAKELGCQEAEFVAWADKSPVLTRKPSEKHNDKFYYALVARIGAEVPAEKEAATAVVQTPGTETQKTEEPKKDKEKKDKQKKNAIPSSITEEERLAFAQLHMLCGNLLTVMDFYGNRLALRHPDAFGHLTRTQKELRAAVALLQAGIKIEEKRLPPLDQI